MKNTLLPAILIIIVSFKTTAQSPWEPVTSGTGETLTSLYFSDEQTGVVVGYGGVILKTTNGGVTWNPQYSGTTNRFYATFFTDAQTGWAVGDFGTIQHTVDGGTSWNPVFSPASSADLRAVWFLNPNVGFITGGFSGSTATIIKTTDGGATWNDISPNSYQVVYSIFFTSPSDGYARDYDGKMLKTTDGGTTWSEQTVSANNLHSIFFTDANTGYVAGGNVGSDSGVILKTTDAGLSWTEYAVPQGFLTSITFLDANTGIATGGSVANNEAIILKTTDAGNTWALETIEPSPASRQFRVFMASYQAGFSCGLNGTILRTTGITSTTAPQQTSNISAAIFPNPTPGTFTVELAQPATPDMIFRITDLTGRLLQEKQADAGSTQQMVQVDKLADGLYFLLVISEGHTLSTERFVKQ